MKSENEKAIKKEDVKILKVKKLKKKTPEQIEEEKRLKAAQKSAKKSADKTAEKKPRRKKSAPEPKSEQLEIQTDGIDLEKKPAESSPKPQETEKAYEIEVNPPKADAEAPSAETAQAPKKIIFLCTGNTCRSPMAEFIFKATAAKYGRSGEFEVSSAGLGADGGVGLAENSAFALASLGIPFTNRKSIQMSIKSARDADLIICMTLNHKQAMGGLKNCVTLSELCGCGDIPDPYGQSKEVYINTARVLTDAIERLFK